MSQKRVAIIFHEKERYLTQHYAIKYLADIWQEKGINTVFVFGTKRFVPADLAILHVDLSVVPEEYIEFAQDYPLVLNGKVKDIRKSTFSDHIIHPGDDYKGKIIVKSNLNFAGEPERRVHPVYKTKLFREFMKRMARSGLYTFIEKPWFYSPADYLIIDNPNLVPESWFRRNDIVIEKYLPEIDEGCYCIRNYNFLGDRHTCVRRKGLDPIVYSNSAISIEPADVHPEIVGIRRKLHFDYGKFDYVMNGGVPVLLDINKTPGAAPATQVLHTLRREWAAGILSYFSHYA